MAGNNTISISFKIADGAKGFKELTADAAGFRKVISEAVKESERLKSSAINFAALATGLDSVSRTVSDVQAAFKNLTDAYAVQETAERKLETVMRQRMGATDAEIQSIKELAGAQQQIGVIGDEVQLSGAQQVATFLKEKSSLDALIPAMNNLLAQQKGLNATTEDAVSVGNLMGKAMQGQTSALTRVGITFTEAQKHVMKYGTESERAAMLAQIITDNVGDMNRQLAQTDTGKQKQLENTLGDIKEKIGALVSGALPYVTIAANTMLALTATMKLAEGVKALIVWANAAKVATARWVITAQSLKTIVMLGAGSTKKAAQAMRIYSVAARGSAASSVALGVAIRGLLIATGVGVAIAVLTGVIAYFVSSADDATDSTNKLIDAEARAKAESDRVEQARRQEASTLEQSRAALELNINKLREFKGTKEQEKKIVAEMNDTYGDTMGYFNSVSQWYDALIANSEAYCRQMVIEARMRMLANQIAQKEQETHDIMYDDKGNLRKYSTKRETEDVITGTYNTNYGTGYYTEKREKVGSSDAEKANAALRQNVEQVANLRQQMKDAAGEASKLHFNVKGSTQRPTGGNGGGKPAHQTEKTELQEISDLISKYTEQYVNASDEERVAIRQNISELTTKRRAIELAQKAASRPIEITTLQDIDDEITYQQALRRNATAKNIAGIDAEIERLKKLREETDKAGFKPLPIGDIKTYEQLNQQLAYYNEQLEKADAIQRAAIQNNINQLNALKKSWDDALDDLTKPADISALNNIEQLDDAIGYYQEKQRTASDDEIANIQRVIIALEKKRAAMQRSVELPSMVAEADEINKLTGREYKIKVHGMGFDELTSKIEELQRMLNDTDNPVSESQRKDIESLISTYEQWRKEGVMTFDTFRSGYDSIKSIGSGVESLTDVLEGNGNAWQTVTGIVDGFLQIYDGIKTIIGIINMLSTATTAHATAKAAESVAIGVATGAQTAEAVTAEAAAQAQIPIIAANKLATASYMELAAATYFAAHAYIPFAGFRIASGFVSAATAMVEAIGVMPFADGGIVSGPTVGLIGEYAGASNNPEVVAPLDKLRGMLNPVGEPVIIGGTLRASGREIICVLANETRIASKSGRKTNIKI